MIGSMRAEGAASGGGSIRSIRPSLRITALSATRSMTISVGASAPSIRALKLTLMATAGTEPTTVPLVSRASMPRRVRRSGCSQPAHSMRTCFASRRTGPSGVSKERLT